MLKTSITGSSSLAGPLVGPAAPIVLDSAAILRLIDEVEGDGCLLPAACEYTMHASRVAVADASQQFQYGANIGTAKQSAHMLLAERDDFSTWALEGEENLIKGGLLPLRWFPAPRHASDNLVSETRNEPWRTGFNHMPTSAYYDESGRIHVEPSSSRSIYRLGVFIYNAGITEAKADEMRTFNESRVAHISSLRQEVASGRARRYYVECAQLPPFIARPSDSDMPPDFEYSFQLKSDIRPSLEKSNNRVRIAGISLGTLETLYQNVSLDFSHPALSSQVLALVMHLNAEGGDGNVVGFEMVNVPGRSIRPLQADDPAPFALLDSDLWEDGGTVQSLGFDGTITPLPSVIYDLTAHPITHDRPYAVVLCALPLQFWVQDQGEAYFKKEV
jgi:hypothetical protein